MDPATIYGLVSALAYGGADYLSQTAGRNVGAWRASFYYYFLGFAGLSVWMGLHPVGLQRASTIPLSGWLISFGSGLSLLAAVVLFTEGLAIGSIAVVAPVTASYGAVTTLLSSIAGERFTNWVGLGLLLTILGACVAAIPSPGKSWTGQSSGIGWACGAAVAYGFGFWLQGLVVPVMGSLLPVWAVYTTGVLVMGALRMLRLIDLATPRALSLMAPGLASAILSIIAFVTLTTAFGTGRVAVPVVLSSLTSAVTVILARLIDRVRMAWHQWAAIATIVLGLCMMRV